MAGTMICITVKHVGAVSQNNPQWSAALEMSVWRLQGGLDPPIDRDRFLLIYRAKSLIRIEKHREEMLSTSKRALRIRSVFGNRPLSNVKPYSNN